MARKYHVGGIALAMATIVGCIRALLVRLMYYLGAQHEHDILNETKKNMKPECLSLQSQAYLGIICHNANHASQPCLI